MSVSGKGARRKGIKFEQLISEEFRDLGWKKAGRHLEFQSEEAKGYDLKETAPFHVQCKKCKGYVSVNTIEEIEPKLGYIPIVITKGDYKPAMVIIPWKNFKDILATYPLNPRNCHEKHNR